MKTITVKDIEKKTDEKWMLQRVSCEFSTDRINLVIGRNGVGKTTLLRILCKLDNPSSGTIDNSFFNRCVFLSSNVYDFLLPWYTVLQNISFFSSSGRSLKLGIDEVKSSLFSTFIEEFNISEFLERRIWQLSHGQQALVCLSCALASQPNLLALDEFIEIFDLESQKSISEWLMESIADDFCVIVVSHCQGVVDILKNEENNNILMLS